MNELLVLKAFFDFYLPLAREVQYQLQRGSDAMRVMEEALQKGDKATAAEQQGKCSNMFMFDTVTLLPSMGA